MARYVDSRYKGSCEICKKALFESDLYIMVKSGGKEKYYCRECYNRVFKK